MGSAGSDPASTDFQSVAFTRLAYFPCHLWIFTILNPRLFSRQRFIHKMNIYPMHKNSSTLSLDIIFTGEHGKERIRTSNVYHEGPDLQSGATPPPLPLSQIYCTHHQPANHNSVFYCPTSAVVLFKHD